MARKLAQDVAAAQRSAVAGRFERHVSQNWRELTGSISGGRWGPPGSYSVLYLGRPRASVTVEAYRHLVDPFAEFGMTGDMVAPRRLLVCEVSVTDVLDLRGEAAQLRVGLTESDLISEVGSYGACQAVGRVAHQLGLHGIIAPAGTGLGETLALFEQHLPANELPLLVAEEQWDVLPADPRRLRLVRGDEETA
jgi:RES domain-containing protein